MDLPPNEANQAIAGPSQERLCRTLRPRPVKPVIPTPPRTKKSGTKGKKVNDAQHPVKVTLKVVPKRQPQHPPPLPPPPRQPILAPQQPARMATSSLKSSISIDPYDSTTDAQEFIDNFGLYARALELNDNQKVAAFPLCVTDHVKLWYNSLPAATKNDFALLTAAFLERFRPHPTEAWSQVSVIFSMTQQPTQSVMTFIDQVRNQSTLAQLPEAQQVQAILKGLQPNARALIVQQNPRNMQELLQHARVADAALGTTKVNGATTPVAAAATLTTPTKLETQLQELSDKVTLLMTMSVNDSRNPRPSSRDNYRYRDQSKSPARGYSPARPSREYTPERYQRAPRESTPDRQRNNYRNDNYGNYQAANVNRNGNRRVSFQMCKNCGEYTNHKFRSQCKAFGKTCSNCSKLNHFAKVCRSAQR